MASSNDCLLFPTRHTQVKTKQIQALFRNSKNSLWDLQQLAVTRGGLWTDSLRRVAYPVLMGCSNNRETCDVTNVRSKSLKYCSQQKSNNDKDKLDCLDWDVARGTWDHLPGASLSDRQAYLKETIVYALGGNHSGNYHYYQGLHLIAAHLGHDRVLLRAVVQRRLWVQCAPDFTVLQWIFQYICPVLCQFFDLPATEDQDKEESSNIVHATTSLILPHVLSWFASCEPYQRSRYVDVLLASHPAMIFYLAVAHVGQNGGVEATIADSLRVMARLPPSRLIWHSLRVHDNHESATNILQSLTADQQQLLLRMFPPETPSLPSQWIQWRYPTACVAQGCVSGPTRRRRRRMVRRLLFVVLTTLLCAVVGKWLPQDTTYSTQVVVKGEEIHPCLPPTTNATDPRTHTPLQFLAASQQYAAQNSFFCMASQ